MFKAELAHRLREVQKNKVKTITNFLLKQIKKINCKKMIN